MAPPQPVSMETEEGTTTAAGEMKEDQQEDKDEGPDQSTRVVQQQHQDGEHEKMEGEEEKTEEEEALGTITSTTAAQGTEVLNHRTRPQEDQHLHHTGPSCTPVQAVETSAPQDHVQEETYTTPSALSPASPDIIEVHSDRSEDRDFDEVDGDDDKDSLSQRSSVTDESETLDVSRGNLGLLEQAIALKAQQGRPGGPDVPPQRYITLEDRPQHLDALRKSYFSKGGTSETWSQTSPR